MRCLSHLRCLRFQGKPFNIIVIQVYAPTSNAEEAEVERFYEDLQDLLELTPQKDALFIIGDWNAKVGSQETSGKGKGKLFSRVRLPATPWNAAHQAPPSVGFSRQEYWSGETPGVTGKFGLGIQNEAGKRLIEFCEKNALVIANTLFQQHKRRLYTWTSPDGQH